MINTKPLIKFLLWTFTLFLVCIVGITGVFAETTTQTFNSFNTTAESLSNSIQCNNNICVVYGVTQYNYQMNFEWGSLSDKTCQNASTVSGKLSLSRTSMGITNKDFLWSNVYIVNNNNSINCNYQVGSNDTTFSCTVDNLKPNFKIGYSLNTMGGQYTYDSVIYRSMDITCDTSTTQIIENNNANTQNIINNQNTNNENLIDNNNQNTQNIINNNNLNTNEIIEENKKNFNDCRNSYNLFNPNEIVNGYTNDNNGNYYGNGISTGLIEIKPNTKYYILSSKSEGNWGAFYDSNTNYINGIRQPSFNNGKAIIESPSNAKYLRFTISYNNNNPDYANNVMIVESPIEIEYEKYGEEICINKLDEQKNAINNVDNTLKDDSVDENGVADAFESFNDYLDDNSTITQLITLPITLYTAILNNLNGSCSPFNLGQLYGEDLILPCINISHYLGSSLWSMIDIIISGFAIYAISKKMIKVFNNFSSLREGDVIDD